MLNYLFQNTTLCLYQSKKLQSNRSQVERRPQTDVGDAAQVDPNEMTFIEHREGQWTTTTTTSASASQHHVMQMPSATHQLIHGSPPGTTHQLVPATRDESDDGYRTHSSSSSSCSDGNSPQSQITSESPPPGKVSFSKNSIL